MLSDPSYNLRVAGVGAALCYPGRDTFNRQTALCYEKGTLIARLSGSSTADGDVAHSQNANSFALFRRSCGRAPTWSRVPVRREEMPFARHSRHTAAGAPKRSCLAAHKHHSLIDEAAPSKDTDREWRAEARQSVPWPRALRCSSFSYRPATGRDVDDCRITGMRSISRRWARMGSPS